MKKLRWARLIIIDLRGRGRGPGAGPGPGGVPVKRRRGGFQSLKMWIFLVLCLTVSQLRFTSSEAYLQNGIGLVGTQRTCTVQEDGELMDHLCTSSDFSFPDNYIVWKDDLCGCNHAQYTSTVCPGYRGMNLTFQCRTAGAGVIYSVLENRSLGEGEYRFDSLQSVHAGEYQCRSNDSEIAASYNITVYPGK